jgi:nucleoside-diphosphate-sugar epimerase
MSWNLCYLCGGTFLLPLSWTRAYNVCGETFSKAEIYARLQAELGLPVPQQESAPSVRGVSDMRVESTRLRALGWSPTYTLVQFAAEKEVQV